MTTKKYPAPVYAAAGAGDYAYQTLRKLPAVLNDLPGKVAELRGKVGAPDRDLRSDLDRVRAAAKRNAETALAEARTVYAGLIARGEKVVEGGTGASASTDVAVRKSREVAQPVEAVKAATKPTKPVKRTGTAVR